MLKEEIKGISRRYIIQSLCMLAVVTLIPILLSLLTNVGDLTAPTIVALVFAAVVETVDALVWGKVRQAGEDEYCLVFIGYYFAIMTHHSLFFARISNSHTSCDNENK